jgi:hypothetical protein
VTSFTDRVRPDQAGYGRKWTLQAFGRSGRRSVNPSDDRYGSVSALVKCEILCLHPSGQRAHELGRATRMPNLQGRGASL